MTVYMIFSCEFFIELQPAAYSDWDKLVSFSNLIVLEIVNVL